MARYKLSTGFYDGKRLHDRGAILSFEEGKAPKGSILVPEDEVAEEPKGKKEPVPTSLKELQKTDPKATMTEV